MHLKIPSCFWPQIFTRRTSRTLYVLPERIVGIMRCFVCRGVWIGVLVGVLVNASPCRYLLLAQLPILTLPLASSISRLQIIALLHLLAVVARIS